MTEATLTISNKLGLHARAAAKFVQLATSFNSDIQLQHEHRKVNGKSIMGVMMLAASKGTTLTLHAEGEDAEQATAALSELVNDRFGEDE
ncbi:MAG: HPr family phosphocarrier protein [Granulosicoccaceae bacterium]|jgi:phosphocarrier protein